MGEDYILDEARSSPVSFFPCPRGVRDARRSQVLLLGSASETVVGRPLVPDARVVCSVEEQTKDAKVVIFKKRKRKASRRRNGFRRMVTLLRVTDIIEAPAAAATP